MSIYRFLGTLSNIEGATTLNTFGQAVELPDDLAREAILGNCAIIPQGVFDDIGFTESELALHSAVGTHADAPSEFRAKVKAAGEALHRLRVELEGG